MSRNPLATFQPSRVAPINWDVPVLISESYLKSQHAWGKETVTKLEDKAHTFLFNHHYKWDIKYFMEIPDFEPIQVQVFTTVEHRFVCWKQTPSDGSSPVVISCDNAPGKGTSTLFYQQLFDEGYRLLLTKLWFPLNDLRLEHYGRARRAVCACNEITYANQAFWFFPNTSSVVAHKDKAKYDLIGRGAIREPNEEVPGIVYIEGKDTVGYYFGSAPATSFTDAQLLPYAIAARLTDRQKYGSSYPADSITYYKQELLDFEKAQVKKRCTKAYKWAWVDDQRCYLVLPSIQRIYETYDAMNLDLNRWNTQSLRERFEEPDAVGDQLDALFEPPNTEVQEEPVGASAQTRPRTLQHSLTTRIPENQEELQQLPPPWKRRRR